MKKYKLIKKKGEGTFSEVVQAQNIETEKMFAVKCMKNSFKSLQQVSFESSKFESAKCIALDWIGVDYSGLDCSGLDCSGVEGLVIRSHE